MKELVLLVGPPGAGKTTYCQTVLPEHARLSQDEGPRDFRVLYRRFLRMLAAGDPRIVIDRTNPTRARRTAFALPARTVGYRVRIVHFVVPREVCEQRIRDRLHHPTLAADTMHQALQRYYTEYQPPTPDECDELVLLSHRA